MKITIDIKMCDNYRTVRFKFCSEYVPKECFYNLKLQNIK